MLSGGIEARQASDRVLIEGFEDGDIAEYSGPSLDYFEVTSTDPIEGAYSLKATSKNEQIGTDSIITSRGYEYGCTFRPAATGSQNGMIIHSQDATNPFHNCYWVRLWPEYDRIIFYERVDGNANWQMAADGPDGSITAGSEYTVYLRLPDDGSDTIGMEVQNAAGDVLAGSSTTNGRFSTGYLGFRSSVGGTGTYYDAVTRRLL